MINKGSSVPVVRPTVVGQRSTRANHPSSVARRPRGPLHTPARSFASLATRRHRHRKRETSPTVATARLPYRTPAVPMRIGLDLDDTITRAPEFFSLLSSTFRAAGHSVVIITFRTGRDQAMRDLAAAGVVYDRLVTWDLRDNDSDTIDQWKGQVCDALEVDYMFDDRPEILNHLPPRTVGFLVLNPLMGSVWQG